MADHSGRKRRAIDFRHSHESEHYVSNAVDFGNTFSVEGNNYFGSVQIVLCISNITQCGCSVVVHCYI